MRTDVKLSPEDIVSQHEHPISFLRCLFLYYFQPIDAGLYIIGSVVGVALTPPAVQSCLACVLQSTCGEECIGWYSAFVLVNYLLTRCRSFTAC